MEVGQVPFLPFISSSSALLQLSVEPCRTQRVDIKSHTEKRQEESGRKEGENKKASFFFDVEFYDQDMIDSSGHSACEDTVNLTDRWRGGCLPPRSTNQPRRQPRGHAQSRPRTPRQQCDRFIFNHSFKLQLMSGRMLAVSPLFKKKHVG